MLRMQHTTLQSLWLNDKKALDPPDGRQLRVAISLLMMRLTQMTSATLEVVSTSTRTGLYIQVHLDKQ